MRTKENWTIPKNKLSDGWILSRRNAERLLKSAEILFENDQFSASLSLSVLALEEFGKFLMLQDADNEDKVITSRTWREEFLPHTTKLKATPRILAKQPTRIEKNKVMESMNKISEIFEKWGKLKLDNIYVDWNPKIKKWWCPNNDNNTKKQAKEIIRRIKDLIKPFENFGDLVNTTTQEKINLLAQNKAYAVCENCGLVLWDIGSIRNHKDKHTKPILSWWSMPEI